jgi:hypothetical protein
MKPEAGENNNSHRSDLTSGVSSLRPNSVDRGNVAKNTKDT